MKKTCLLAVFAAGMSLALTGCVTHYRDAGADYLKRPESNFRAPYYTEFKVSEKKVAGHGEASVLLWLFQISDGKYCQLGLAPRLSIFSILSEIFSPTQRAVFNAKSSAMYQACEVSSADQILGATFEYKITDYFFYAKVECTAKGFPATALSVKMLDKQPIILNSWQRVEYLRPYEVPSVYSDPEHSAPPSGIFGTKADPKGKGILTL